MNSQQGNAHSVEKDLGLHKMVEDGHERDEGTAGEGERKTKDSKSRQFYVHQRSVAWSCVVGV